MDSGNGEAQKIDSYQMRSGVEVTLQQRSPSCVIECAGVSVVLEEAIVASIFVFVAAEGALAAV